MALTLSLAASEARLLYLAITYLLGHPRWRSEFAPKPEQQYLHGLLAQLEPCLDAGEGPLELRTEPPAFDLLESALLRVTNELKSYPMLKMASGEERPVSTVPGFDEVLNRLYPALQHDPSGVEELAAALVALRRDVQRAKQEVASAPHAAERRRHRRGRFWGRP